MAKKPKTSKSSTENASAVSALELEWEDIDPAFFAGARSQAPTYPIEVLPQRFGSTVSAVAQARCVNIDFVASSLIAIASGAVGNRVRLAITARRTEPGVIFMALVAEPGDGKTEAFDIARECFNSIESLPGPGRSSTNALQPDDPVMMKVEQQRNLAARKKLAIDGVAPVDGTMRQVTSANKRKLLLSQATVAGIRDGLVSSPEGRVFLADELINVMNITSGQDRIGARTLLLEAFEGKPHVISNARDGEIEIEALQLTILGGTQPDRVGLLLGNAHDGMAPRFLWCAPDVVRFDDIADSDGPMDDLILALGRLADIVPRGLPGAYPALIEISKEAREIVREANSDWNAQLRIAPRVMKSLLARARTQALRLSMNLALCERALAGEELPGGEITGEDVQRGIALMNRYYLPMGERVITEISKLDPEPPSVQLARHLARMKKPVINVRDDIRRGPGSPLRDPDEIEQNLEELRLRGLVKSQIRARASGGRPTTDWLVNPKLFKLQA
jgi:hypothetical protein